MCCAAGIWQISRAEILSSRVSSQLFLLSLSFLSKTGQNISPTKVFTRRMTKRSTKRTEINGSPDNTPTQILRPEKNPSNAGAEECAKIVVIQGATPGLQVTLNRPKTTIGRRQSSDLVLDSTTVSRRHGRVTRDNNRYEIEDIHSQNGILINNERLKPTERRPLYHGDTLKLGDQQLVFLNPSAFGDQRGISDISFDREKVRAEVDTLLERIPALKKSRPG
jgi:pSer/pThr/pTyr-binding forkhead associated (FHA) protein